MKSYGWFEAASRYQRVRTVVRRASGADAPMSCAAELMDGQFGGKKTGRGALWENQGPLSFCPEARHMQNQKLFEEINERVRAILAQSPAADIEKNMRAMLTALFSRLDLVTREEFDVQEQVLARTREKLAQLEAKVAELEKKT